MTINKEEKQGRKLNMIKQLLTLKKTSVNSQLNLKLEDIAIKNEDKQGVQHNYMVLPKLN